MNDKVVLILSIGFCLILLGLIGLRLLPAVLSAKYNRATPALSAHLKSHIVAKGPLSGDIAFAFPDDFYAKKLILLGEIHGYGAMYKIDYQLLTHLHGRAGIVDYLAEMGPVEAAHINAYLDSGDQARLKPVFDGWRGTMRWANADFIDKLAHIHVFNQTLSADRRIRFTGIDQIQNFDILHLWLGLDGPRLEAADTTALAALYLDKVKAAPADSVRGGQKTKDEVLVALGSMAKGLEREAVIFENYAWQVREGALGERPAYGIWGINHVLRGPIDGGFLPFSARVAASDLPAAHSIAAIAAWSDRGTLMMANNEFKGAFASKTHTGKASRLLENEGPLYYVYGLNDLRAGYDASGLKGSGAVIFDIRGASSPFASATGFGQIHTLYRYGLSYDAPQKPVTDLFDYALVVRGSPAARPLKL